MVYFSGEILVQHETQLIGQKFFLSQSELLCPTNVTIRRKEYTHTPCIVNVNSVLMT